MGKTIKKIFTKKELKQIPEMYKAGQSTNVIREKMHTSIKKIKQILLDAGIDIDNPNCEYIKHKPANYWNNKEHCEEVAKQCRNRSEFGDRFSRAYEVSNKNNWLKDFDKYFSKEIKYYGFNDKIHCVYAYEVENEHAVYVGRTINIKQRHASHKRGSFKTNHRVYSDSVYDFCQSIGVEVPEPKILESGLVATESQKKEKEWIDWYDKRGWIILNRASTGEGCGSLGATVRKWDYESCSEAAALCSSKIEFKKRFSTGYRVSVQNGWINDFFTNLNKERGCFDTLEGCIEESKKFKNLTDIKKNYPFLYQKICKNKWNDDVRIANGWEKFGEVKKDRILNTKDVKKEKKELECIPIDMNLMSPYEKQVYCYIRHFNCKLLNDSVYGSRLNFLLNDKLVVGVDTIKNNLEFKCGVTHMVFLNELINYNELGYYMIHIFDSDLEYESIVWDKIDNALGFIDKKNVINGRDCEVREIYKHQSDLFLNENHIQGECKATIYLGAFYRDELVAVMCFRRGGVSCLDGWELVRFASKINYVIRGIGGKLLKQFVKKYMPNKITSFCDRRYSIDINDNFYTKNGFVLDCVNRPDYYYVDTSALIPRIYHKLYFNKKKLSKQYGFPMTMTETEMAKELGYDRIWNCGLIKYVWKKE